MIDAIFLAPVGWSDRVETVHDNGDSIEVFNTLIPELKHCCWTRPQPFQMPGTMEFEGKRLIHALIMSADLSPLLKKHLAVSVLAHKEKLSLLCGITLTKRTLLLSAKLPEKSLCH